MARIGVNYETVKQTAVKLLSQGMAPSVQKIREVLGTGSNTTIAEHLKVWREEYAQKTIHHLPSNMPKELISVFEVLWQTAMEQAQGQLAEYKQTLDGERETMVEVQRETEKVVTDIKQKLTESAARLEQEIADKQKLSIELAIANERLIKQEETHVDQKNQYEDRLKRVYEEKDGIIAQCYQIQNEVKLLQEKITSQAEQHQNLLAQQSALHEQSENRWLKLLDQQKQETKEAYIKLENLRLHNEEKIKKITTQLYDTEHKLHSNNIQLNFLLEQIKKFKQDGQAMEAENIGLRSMITELEKEKQSKKKIKNISAIK